LRYTGLMTRHNLDSHISWLLSHEVTPPVGVQAVLPTHSRIKEGITDEEFLEEETEEEIIRSPPNPARNRQVLETVNVVQDFARPPTIPSSIIPRSQMPEPHPSRAEGAMGTLTLASKPTRPKLVSQPQLATPASTTTSTAPSSLKQGYATFLRNNSGLAQSFYSVVDSLADFSRNPLVKTIK
jgi:bloom syndrome protein